MSGQCSRVARGRDGFAAELPERVRKGVQNHRIDSLKVNNRMRGGKGGGRVCGPGGVADWAGTGQPVFGLPEDVERLVGGKKLMRRGARQHAVGAIQVKEVQPSAKIA